MPAITNARIIMHVDMDAFYASVEQRNNPRLRGKPVIVGGKPNSRGVVATCSYEARRYGVHSAMSAGEAYRRCPHAIFVSGNFDAYTHASREVMSILRRYSPLVQAASIDEAFLDISDVCNSFREAVGLGGRIKRDIAGELGFTCSAGIGPSRQIAKIASGLEKPDGLTCVAANEIVSKIYPLPVSKIWGVGPVTYERLQAVGIGTIAELVQAAQSQPDSWFRRLADALTHDAGKNEHFFLRDTDQEQPEKSISHGRTLSADISDPDLVDAMIVYLTDKVVMRMQRRSWQARTLGLRLRFADFRTITRDVTVKEPTDDFGTICKRVKKLVPRRQVRVSRVRLVGVRVSNLSRRLVLPQVDLFADSALRQRKEVADVVRSLRDKFGDQAVFRATTMLTPD